MSNSRDRRGPSGILGGGKEHRTRIRQDKVFNSSDYKPLVDTFADADDFTDEAFEEEPFTGSLQVESPDDDWMSSTFIGGGISQYAPEPEYTYEEDDLELDYEGEDEPEEQAGDRRDGDAGVSAEDVTADGGQVHAAPSRDGEDAPSDGSAVAEDEPAFESMPMPKPEPLPHVAAKPQTSPRESSMPKPSPVGSRKDDADTKDDESGSAADAAAGAVAGAAASAVAGATSGAVSGPSMGGAAFGSQMPEGIATGAAAYSRSRYTSRGRADASGRNGAGRKGAESNGRSASRQSAGSNGNRVGANGSAGAQSNGRSASRQSAGSNGNKAEAGAQQNAGARRSPTPHAGGGVSTGHQHTSSRQGTGSGGKRHRRSAYKKRLRRRNVIIVVVIALVLVIGGCGVAFAVSAMDARADASTLVNEGKVLATQLKDGNTTNARETAQEITETAKKLDKNVNGPLWTLATIVPALGEDISQVRTLANVASTLSDEVLIPVVGAVPEGGMKKIFSDYTINVDAVQGILKPIGASADTIHECALKVGDMGTPHLDQLKEPVTMLKDLFVSLDGIASYATDLSNALPGILGANGTRTYLVAAVSQAEQRCIAGFPGSAGIMTMENGKMTIGEFDSPARKSPRLSEGNYLDVPAEEKDLFGERITAYFFDTSFIPDFPRAAELMNRIWVTNGNDNLDGIIAVSPVFLQRLLALTGSVTASDGTVVDGTNAAELLTNTVYIKYSDENAEQDAFFSDVASKAINKVFGNINAVDVVKLMEAFGKSFEDNNFSIWINNEADENVMKELGWAGAVSTSEVDPETGVYFGSAMGAKMFWYLDADVERGAAKRNADGSYDYEMKVTFTNTLSEEEAASAPRYITGVEQAKRSKSDMLMDVYLFAPVGGSISDLKSDGFFTGSDYLHAGWNTTPGTDPMTRATYNGNEVWYGMTQIKGGESTTFTYTVTTSTKAQSELEVSMSPVANENL